MKDTQDAIVLRSPLDMHVHFRQGELLKGVVPLSARSFAGCLVMPNTEPIIEDKRQALAYQREIEAAAGGETLTPYMTLYLRPRFNHVSLGNLSPHILAVKFYPKNLTTNSQHGCDPKDPEVWRVLGIMEDLGIPLCVHAEALGYHEDREWLFHSYVNQWTTLFPDLKIILEHISDRRTLELVRAHENVYATVTPHHLLITGDDWVGPPLQPHLFCMPVAKRPEDKTDLQYAVLGSQEPFASKLMLGTDSAPHWVDKKECASGCAGIFQAPIALQLLAELFWADSSPERFQAFASDNARRIYGITPPDKTVRLVRKPFEIPLSYRDVIPMWAGKTIEWSVDSVT